MTMKYKIFSYNDKPSVVYIEDGKNITKFSEDKESDEFFKEWVPRARKEGFKVNLEEVSTGWNYYTSEEGDYAKDKEKVAKILKGFGYDAP